MFVQRSSQKAGHGGCACCWPCAASSRQVAPLEGSYAGYDMVQTSEGRVLRVRHLNATPRDAQLEAHKQTLNRTTDKPPTPSSYSSQRTKSAGPMRGSLRRMYMHESPSKSSQGSSHVVSQNNTPQHRKRSEIRTATGVDVANVCATNIGDDDVEEIPFIEKQTHTDSKHIKRTPIFLFHGVGGSSDVWTSQMEYFDEHSYEIIAPDLLGHGLSSSSSDPSAYSFKQMASDLIHIFDKYCKKSNIIVAHSYGCSFACYVAHERPSWVSRLVLISGGSPTPLAPQPGVFTWSTACLACCLPILRTAFYKSAFHPGGVVSPGARACALDVPPHVLKHTMTGQDWGAGDQHYHGAISAPTLVLHGAADQLIPAHEDEEMTATLPNAEMVVIDDASHMVMMERPARVNTLIHDFLMREINIDDPAATQHTTTHPQVI